MKNKMYYQLVASFTLLFFVALCYILRFYPGTLTGFDRGIISVVHSLSPGADNFFIWLTKFGNPASVVILTLVFLGLFWFNRQKVTALWFGINIIGICGILNPVIKQFFKRPRPTILTHLVEEHSYSFPSGHAVTSMILFGTLIFVMPLFFKNTSLRLAAQIILGLLILGIGVSRIYVGVHYPSDVLGGFLLGISWLLFSFPYYREKKLIYDMKQIGRK